MNHESRFQEAAFEARLRADAARFRRTTPAAFTARVVRDLSERSESTVIFHTATRPPRFARMLLAAAVLALAAVSGMYIGSPWSSPSNNDPTGHNTMNIAQHDEEPALIRTPRVTINLGFQKTLREGATAILTRASTLRESLINRLPLQGQAAPETNGG